MKDINKLKSQKQIRRAARSKAKVALKTNLPRLTVFRSLKHISCQLLDDQTGKVLAVSSSQKLTGKTEVKDMNAKIAQAYKVGENLAKQAMAKGVKQCVFDKSGYKYHGRVKALADGARQLGLKF